MFRANDPRRLPPTSMARTKPQAAAPVLNPQTVPRHVAIIMDGNGRWAKQRGGLRIFGHRSALTAVRECVEGSREVGVEYLTLYTFSTENWSRPKAEVMALMELLVDTIRKETPDLHRNNVRVNAIGDLERLPRRAQEALTASLNETQHNTGLVLTLALSYGSRVDILAAVRHIAEDVQAGRVQPNGIDERLFSSYLSTHNLPDPEFLIRTSGEFRVSNFLLWEIAYAELYVTPKLWPDFRKADFLLALHDYQQRERRFGQTSDQLLPASPNDLPATPNPQPSAAA
jgi:undecaprenyl diphosphate synthase